MTYRALSRETTCDSQGNFTFDRIADGTFYVTTRVTWEVQRYSTEGGYLFQRVTLGESVQRSIVLTN